MSQFLTSLTPQPWIDAITGGMDEACRVAAQPRADQTVLYCVAGSTGPLQFTSAQPPSVAETVSDAPWSGAAWANPGNVTTVNTSSFASITTTAFDTGVTSQVLKCQGFDFSSLPDEANIIGVIANFHGNTPNGTANIDLAQLLDISGARAGDNLASTPRTISAGVGPNLIGATTNLWGNALTAAWIKDPNFGISIGCIATSDDTDIILYYVTLNVYWTPAGYTGPLSPDGSEAAPYNMAELQAELDTTPNLYAYMSGTFEQAAYDSIGKIIDITQNGTTIDLWTNSCVVRGYTGTAWTAAGNGEYYTTAKSTSAFIRLTEDGIIMIGVNAHDLEASRMRILSSAVDPTNTITYVAYRTPEVGDTIYLIGAAQGGLSNAVEYFITSTTQLFPLPGATNPEYYEIQVSTTAGGAAVVITADLTGADAHFFSLANGRFTDPVPGSLEPGQYAYAPHEARLYMRPSSGTPDDHVYTYNQSNTDPELIRAGGLGVTGALIIGGEFYGGLKSAINLGDNVDLDYSRVVGATIYGCQRGIQFFLASNCTTDYCHVHHTVSKGIGSIGTTALNAEDNNTIDHCWIHDMGVNFMHFDCEAIVFNIEADRCVVRHSVIQKIGFWRDFTVNPLPLGKLATNNNRLNVSAVTLDDSTNLRVYGNYFQDITGRVIELPADTNHPCSAYVYNNVFDMRGIPGYVAGVTATLGTHCVIRCFAGANGDNPLDAEVHHNLFILGGAIADTTGAGAGAWDVSVFQYRIARASFPSYMKVNVHSNLVILDDDDGEWIIHATRTAGTSELVLDAMQIDIDNNCYVKGAANNTAIGRARFTASSGQITPVDTVAIDNLPDGWIAQSGITCDNESLVSETLHGYITESLRLAPGSPLLGTGLHLGPSRSIAGVQRPNPPSIGLHDVATLVPVIFTP